MFKQLHKLGLEPSLVLALICALSLHLLLLSVPFQLFFSTYLTNSQDSEYNQALSIELFSPSALEPEASIQTKQPEPKPTAIPTAIPKTVVNEPSQVNQAPPSITETEQLPAPKTTPRSTAGIAARSLEVARLEAELHALNSSHSQKVRRLSSTSTMTSEEAFYLSQWQARVEYIGNLNYPEEARKLNLTGQLRLLVVIAPDGSLLEAQLLSSSGHKALDDAAIRILNLAAPFAPLPPSITAHNEVLEIIRTWNFGSRWSAN